MSKNWQDWFHDNAVAFIGGCLFAGSGFVVADKWKSGVADDRIKLYQEKLATTEARLATAEQRVTSLDSEQAGLREKITASEKRAQTAETDVAIQRREVDRIAAALKRGAQEVERLSGENKALRRRIPSRVAEPKKPIELNDNDRKVLSALFKTEHALVLTLSSEYGGTGLPAGAVQNSLDRLKEQGLVEDDVCTTASYAGQAKEPTFTCWSLSKPGRAYAEQIGTK